MNKKPKMFFVGGFLGAGKTTAIRSLTELFAKRGIKTGAITNDQAAGLVDTAFLDGEGLITQEVAGSCFCCNFNGLVQAIDHIMTTADPDVILAEPVGSCTDIVATVILPLQDLLKNKVQVRAYSVLVEPMRWKEIMEEGTKAPWSMKYLFDKQVKEADFVVLTKTDTIGPPALQKIRSDFVLRYGQARFLPISSREGIGLDAWMEAVLSTTPGNRWLKEIDYEKYAQAEAEMGWLNAEADVIFPGPVDGRDIAVRMVRGMADGITGSSAQIGHLKLLAVGETGGVKAGISAAGQGGQLDGSFSGPVSRLHVTLNARATVSPGDLAEIVTSLMMDLKQGDAAQTDILYLNAFKPAPPNPTYRYSGEDRP
jgi:Ni2+-binding GTPase involved in maturation of urease and hydrogenase